MDKRLSALGNRSGKFRKLIDENNLVAAYMDDSLSEEDLMSMSIPRINRFDLRYGLIAFNWHVINEKVEFESAYALLIERRPVTQKEFDEILEELETLLSTDVNLN